MSKLFKYVQKEWAVTAVADGYELSHEGGRKVLVKVDGVYAMGPAGAEKMDGSLEVFKQVDKLFQ